MRAYEAVGTVGGFKKGTTHMITYKSDLVNYMKAKAVKEGHMVTEKVRKKVRFGCDYNNMKSTIEAKENGRGTRDMYEGCIVPNILYENKETGQIYLRIGNMPGKGNPVERHYFLDGVEVTKEQLRDVMIPSYFKNKDKPAPEVQNLKIENVIQIGD